MDANEIIAEVARRNRVVLAPTDPVMVVATIAELQMDAGRKALAKVVTEALDQASAGTEQQIEAARKIGESIITSAAAWSAEQIRTAGSRLPNGCRPRSLHWIIAPAAQSGRRFALRQLRSELSCCLS
jgi:hypothetical protein